MSPVLKALRVLRSDRRGSSLPVLVETAEGPRFVKLRGAAQGLAALVAEVLVSAIAASLDLPVPARCLIRIEPDLPSADPDAELADLLRASAGENLGFQYLEGARALHLSEVDRVDQDFASRVVWLDWLVMNPDRSPRNPNILVHDGRWWLIDHGAALPFHHDWSAVTEDAPGRPAPVTPHVLASRATRLNEWDSRLTQLLTRERLQEAVGEIPDSFLRPLLPPGPGSTTGARRRAAYVAFLWKRLHSVRRFDTAPLPRSA